MHDLNALTIAAPDATSEKTPRRPHYPDLLQPRVEQRRRATLASGALRARQLANASGICLDEHQKTHLLALFNECMEISSHAQLFWWLQGAMQEFLPHQVMIAAWGAFHTWKLTLDVVSGIAGARTEWIARCDKFASCRINSTLGVLFSRWHSEGRRPLLVRPTREVFSHAQCTCPLMQAMHSMHSILVHGVHDERGGYDTLYMLFNPTSITNGHSEATVGQLAQLLVPQIDIALRRVVPLPNAETTPSGKPNGESIGLTSREKEIIDWIARGKMNAEIGARLKISTFTVKNHLRRIFRKLGAANRADAIIKYQRTRSSQLDPIAEQVGS